MMKSGFRSAIAIIALSTSAFVSVTPAFAQATRTWISGVGDDVNPCSRTAPCKTFAGAISKTAATGEINCLDPGGFGAVTITKSITLSCEGVTAGVLVAATNGITINAASTDVIRIRGLDMEGLSSVGGSLNGINFLNGGALYVTNVKINGFGGAGGGGYGISFTPGSNATLVVDNVEIIRNGNTGAPTNSGGILIQPPAGVTATASITHTVIANNSNSGIRIESAAAGAVASVALSENVVTNNGIGILLKSPAGLGPVAVNANNQTISQNATAGVKSSGSAATLRVSNSTISGNGIGVSSSSGGIASSYGNNRLNDNTTDGAFTGTTAQQ